MKKVTILTITGISVFAIYSSKYGCELETLIDKSYDDEDYLLSETK